MKTIKKDIILSKPKSNYNIADAKDVFNYIDSDLEDLKTNEEYKEVSIKIVLEIKQLTENSTFAQIFSEPEKMYLSQEQIIEFCRTNKAELSKSVWYTFFLFKVYDKFFVAGVGVGSDGGLRVRVDRLDDGCVWRAEYGRRVVIPQLTPISLDFHPRILSKLETLEQKVANIEKILDDMKKLLA